MTTIVLWTLFVTAVCFAFLVRQHAKENGQSIRSALEDIAFDAFAMAHIGMIVIWALHRHLRTLAKHKYFVVIAGRKLGVGWWRLLVHDLSKLSRHEALWYAMKFYGGPRVIRLRVLPKDAAAGAQLDKQLLERIARRFQRAWLHHSNRNDHHWEYWVSRSNNGAARGPVALRMTPDAMAEMVADWLAASRAYGGAWPTNLETWEWFQSHFPGMHLHADTRRWVKLLLESYFGLEQDRAEQRALQTVHIADRRSETAAQ